MPVTEPQLVLETIDLLVALGDAEAPPPDATAQLHRVAARHGHAEAELLWQPLGPDGGWRYDALLPCAGHGTLSLGFCRDGAQPWVLLDARRWSDADLLRVNDVVLTVDGAVAKLDVLLQDDDIAGQLVDACLVEEALARHPVEVSSAELQCAMDAFRRARGLHGADACRHWMAARGLDHARLERLVAAQARLAKLRDRVTSAQAQAFFEQHRARFDCACIAQIAHADAASALHTAGRIAAHELSFLEAAQEGFLQRPPHGDTAVPLFRRLRRDEGHALALAVFEAQAGALLGPLEVGGRSLLVQVLRLTPAQWDEATAEYVQRLLFRQWLDERRQSARIEWFWRDGR